MSAGFTLAELSLFPATPEQVVASRTRHAQQWARGQSLQHYLHRDAVMEGDQHAVDGKFVTWILAPRSDPTTLDFMCSCETYRRTALVADPEVEEVAAYGIASVYTPPQNRKKGYARHMMRLLHWVLAPRAALPPTFPGEWGAPPDEDMLASVGVANARFSVLYSDVGPGFYQSCGTDGTTRNGWVINGCQETFKLLTGSDPQGSDQASPGSPASNVKRLTETDVLALYEHDARWIREDIASEASASPTTTHTPLTFLPDKGVGHFVIRRTMDFSGSGPAPKVVLPATHWGAAILPPGVQSVDDALSSPSAERRPFVTWTLDLRTSPRTLTVARLRADEGSVRALLDAALAFGREAGVEKVECWYMRPELRALAEAEGWTTRERTEHLSAVKWYGRREPEELEWMYNEKFCWC